MWFLSIILLLIFNHGLLSIGMQLDPRRDGFKSIEAIDPPSCQSYDQYGNILLNGRMGEFPAFFDIASSRQPEAELSVVFCLQDKKSQCRDEGLVLCYPSLPDVVFDTENPTVGQSRIRRICGEMNGVVVNTIKLDSGELLFEITTAYGNRYNFTVPNHNCFILWLTYDAFPYKSPDEYKKFEDYKINPITVFNAIRDLNFTSNDLEYRSEWDDVAVDFKTKKHIWMSQKEVTVFAGNDDRKAQFITIPFVASGGKPCCAITARILGKYVSKCFSKWVTVGDDCRATHPGETKECEIPYTVGRRSVTSVRNVDSIADGQSLSSHNKTHNKRIRGTRDYIDLDTAKQVISQAAQETFQNISSDLIDQFFLNVTGDIHVEAEWQPVESFKLHAFAKVGAWYMSDKLKSNTTMDLTDLYKQFNESINKHLDEILDKKALRDGQEVIAEKFGSKTSEKVSKNALNISTDNRTETHTVRNVVTYPDSIRLGQLHYVCHENEWALKVTADFGNNKKMLEDVYGKELEMGYPNASVYDECPFNQHL